MSLLWVRVELTAEVRFRKSVVLTHVYTEQRDRLVSFFMSGVNC